MFNPILVGVRVYPLLVGVRVYPLLVEGGAPQSTSAIFHPTAMKLGSSRVMAKNFSERQKELETT